MCCAQAKTETNGTSIWFRPLGPPIRNRLSRFRARVQIAGYRTGARQKLRNIGLSSHNGCLIDSRLTKKQSRPMTLVLRQQRHPIPPKRSSFPLSGGSHRSVNSTLYDLPEDVLIYTIVLLSLSDVLLLRQTWNRFRALKRLHFVWTDAFKLDILANDYHCPPPPYRSRALHVSHLWTSVLLACRLSSNPEERDEFLGSPISESKYVPGPGRQHKLVLTIWDIPRYQMITERHDIHCDEAERRPRDDDGALHEIRSVETDLRLVNITGDVIAPSDDVSKTVIYNWKTDERVCLYIVGDISSRRGALRCTDVILSKRAPAVWIPTYDHVMVSRWEEHDGCETLITAVFPGPLNPTAEVRVLELCSNAINNWTALDYDEDLGIIALGSAFRKILISASVAHYVEGLLSRYRVHQGYLFSELANFESSIVSGTPWMRRSGTNEFLILFLAMFPRLRRLSPPNSDSGKRLAATRAEEERENIV
ncbi:hypothetical protein ARMGADRAFT_1066723 [Armillaria gallica]|uniref:F-box domain-containing protein n=1 Tax=Armillaria gallica TaxID=47427 RepID=A0A2H3D5Q2_ARMGA|nr:hypothetical protein ARMGADRAFT_1066723 [Armillaria gallica]